MTRYRYRHPVKSDVLTARVGINGQDYLFFKWPEAAWIANFDMMSRDEEGVNAFQPPERRR